MASELENLFDRLPTELIISIIDKISDLRCLCVCCSVSKLFDALVPRTRSVSVQIPSTVGSYHDEVQVWPPGIMDFLTKLRCVEYVTMRFSPCDPRTQAGPLVRWKSDSSRFILVTAQNLTDDSAVESRGKLVTREYYPALFDSMRNNLYHSKMRGAHIKELLAVLPKLKKVSVVESAVHGSFVLEEDMDSMKRERPSVDSNVLRLKLWTAPLVQLPISGCAMKDVTLISIRGFEGGDDFIDESSFKETEYRELAMIMMKEAPHRETTFPLPMKLTIDLAFYIVYLVQGIQLIE